MNNKVEISIRRLGLSLLCAFAVLQAIAASGCGSTCDRIETDRARFLSREKAATGTHLVLHVPFAVVEQAIQSHVAAIRPIEVQIPNLGAIEQYFGRISIAPSRVTLVPAATDNLGFHLDFDVQRNNEKAFSMSMETSFKPTIDIPNKKIIIGFTPEALANAKIKIAGDAEDTLSELIFAQIPTAARFLIPRDLVTRVTASAVEMLMENLYPKLKEKMLPKLSEMSRIEIALPSEPLRDIHITSSMRNDGFLRLAGTLDLPVHDALEGDLKDWTVSAKDRIALRMTGSAAAELVNWAMVEGRMADRYDAKGNAKKDGELRPGLDWIRGDSHPMKVYLWDLVKPCMRITMSAKPVIAVVNDTLEIKAEDPQTDDVEASAFTKVGARFYLLWKDPVHFDKKRDATVKVTAGGKEMEVTVKSAAIEQDDIVMEASLKF